MGNLCNSTSKPLSQRDEVKSTEVRSTNPINNPKQSAKKTSVSSSAMVVRNGSGDGTEMILGAETTEPAEYDDRTSLDPAKGPGVMLLAHQHTLFCERKQRVCTAVGKSQELEILKAEHLESGSTWQWFRTTQTSTSKLSVDSRSQYTILEKQDNVAEYHLQKEDVGHYIGIVYTTKSGSTKLGHNLIGPILPGPPRILEFVIKGDTQVGGFACAEAKYIGGVEGLSQYWWMRITADGKRFQITEPKAVPAKPTTDKTQDPRYYKLTKDDIGCTLKAKIRPIRTDKAEGEIFTSKSSGKITG